MKLQSPSNRNASLEKASRVLAAFSEDTPELGVMELARRVGLNKSTASRFVSTLTQLGLLERTEGGRKVRLSLRLFELGMRAARHRPLVVEAQSVLQTLSEQAVAWLATPTDSGIVFVSSVTGAHDTSLFEVGRRYPTGPSPMGRFIGMAPCDPAGSSRAGHVPNVLIDKGKILPYVTLIAGAVFDRTGQVVGGVGLAARVIPGRVVGALEEVHLVRRAAADLSRRLGFLRTEDLERGDPPPFLADRKSA